jgi:putative peptidoglycan lipid II flippase
MGVVSAVSRAFGAIRVLVIAAVLGVTYLGNAFQGANQFSTVLFELLAAGALSAVLVPTFVELLDGGDRSRAEHLAGGLLGIALAVLGAVVAVGILAAPWIAELLASGVEDPTVAEQQVALSTYLLRWFIPQLLLYAIGAVATAVLHAQRSFAIPAAAPIANTVVMVALLAMFRLVAGPDPGLVLSAGEQALLGLAGTLGVAAFVAVPTLHLWRSGFWLRPRLSFRDPGVRRLVGLGGWASLQHGASAILLGTAIVVGGAVEGGVVAFQIGWFFFLAPYGVIAQPIQTAVQPELVAEVGRGDRAAAGASVRWSMESMAALLLPVTVVFAILAEPIADTLAFGAARQGDGIELMAAAVASLGMGLLPYGLYLLFARAFYVLGDSRTPAVASVVATAAGGAAMVVVGRTLEGPALLLGLGLAHGVAFLLGALGLGVGLRRRLETPLGSELLLRAIVVAVVVGAAAALVTAWWDPQTRLSDLIALVVVGGGVATAAVAANRRWGVLRLRPGECLGVVP